MMDGNKYEESYGLMADRCWRENFSIIRWDESLQTIAEKQNILQASVLRCDTVSSFTARPAGRMVQKTAFFLQGPYKRALLSLSPLK